MNIKSITSGQHKKVERQKNSFPNKLVEHVDLYKAYWTKQWPHTNNAWNWRIK